MRKAVFIIVLIFIFTLCSCSGKRYIPDYNFNDIASSEGYILACGDRGLISVTADLINWEYKIIDKNINFSNVTSAKGIFYILGTDSSFNSTVYSYSPTDSQIQTLKCDEYYKQIEAVNCHLFAFTQDSIKVSDDGTKWEKISFPTIYDEITQQYQYIPTCMLFDGDNYIVSGGGNFIVSSPDLLKWSFINLNTDGSMCSNGIASNGKEDVIVGDHLFISYKSEDNLWSIDEKINNVEEIDDYYTICLSDVATDGNRFIAVGQRGLILVRDGDTWSVSDSKTNDWLKKIVWNGKYFIVLSEKGFLFSKDCQDWTLVK